MLSLSSAWVGGILLCFCVLIAHVHTADGGNTLNGLDGLLFIHDKTQTRSGPEQGPSDLGERGRHEAERGGEAFSYNRKTSRADAGISPPTSSFSHSADPAPLPIEDGPTDIAGKKEVSPERRGGSTATKKGLGRHRTRATLKRVEVIALFTTITASLFLLRYIRKCILGRSEGSNSTASLGGSGPSRRLAAGGEDEEDPCKPPRGPKKTQHKDDEERVDLIILRIPGKPARGGASSGRRDTPSGSGGESQSTRRGEEVGGTHTGSSSSASLPQLPAELEAILVEMVRAAQQRHRHASQSGSAGPSRQPAPADRHRPRPDAQPGRAPSQQRTPSDPHTHPPADVRSHRPSPFSQPSAVRFPHPGPHAKARVDPSAPPLPTEEPAAHRVPGGTPHSYVGLQQPRPSFPSPQPGHPRPTGPRPPPPPYPGPSSAQHPPEASPLSHRPGAVPLPDPSTQGRPIHPPGHSPPRHVPKPSHRPAAPESRPQAVAPSVTSSLEPSLVRLTLLDLIDEALQSSPGKERSSREGPGGGPSEEDAWLQMLLQRLDDHDALHGTGPSRPSKEEPRPPRDQARGPSATSSTTGPSEGAAEPQPRPPPSAGSRGPADVPERPDPSTPPSTTSVNRVLYRGFLLRLIDAMLRGQEGEHPSPGSEARLQSLLQELDLLDEVYPLPGSEPRPEPGTGPGKGGRDAGAAGYESRGPEESDDIFDEMGKSYSFEVLSPPSPLKSAEWAPGVTGVPRLRGAQAQTTPQRDQRTSPTTQKEESVGLAHPIPQREPERTPSPEGADATPGALRSLPEEDDEGEGSDWSLLVEHGLEPEFLIQSLYPVSDDDAKD